jgi:hypothetical protein
MATNNQTGEEALYGCMYAVIPLPQATPNTVLNSKNVQKPQKPLHISIYSSPILCPNKKARNPKPKTSLSLSLSLSQNYDCLSPHPPSCVTNNHKSRKKLVLLQHAVQAASSSFLARENKKKQNTTDDIQPLSPPPNNSISPKQSTYYFLYNAKQDAKSTTTA